MINEPKIDLACGDNKREGFFGIDIADIDSVDFVWDLNKYPWPIESNSVEELNCSHYIEHVKHDSVALDLAELVDGCDNFEEFKEKIKSKDFLNPKDGLIKFFNEIYRILKPGGKAVLIAPYWSSIRSVGDPTHVRLIADSTCWYLSKDWIEENNLKHYGLECDFDINLSYHISNEMTLKSEEIRNKAFLHDLNTVNDIYIELIKK